MQHITGCVTHRNLTTPILARCTCITRNKYGATVYSMDRVIDNILWTKLSIISSDTNTTFRTKIQAITYFLMVLHFISTSTTELKSFTLYKLTHRSRVPLKKLTVSQPVKKFQPFRETECSLPVQQSPPLVPTLSQMNSVHTSTFYFLKIHFNIILRLCLGLFPSGFRTKILYAFFLSSKRVCPCTLYLNA
jgi:hypothetical protein